MKYEQLLSDYNNGMLKSSITKMIIDGLEIKHLHRLSAIQKMLCNENEQIKLAEYIFVNEELYKGDRLQKLIRTIMSYETNYFKFLRDYFVVDGMTINWFYYIFIIKNIDFRTLNFTNTIKRKLPSILFTDINKITKKKMAKILADHLNIIQAPQIIYHVLYVRTDILGDNFIESLFIEKPKMVVDKNVTYENISDMLLENCNFEDETLKFIFPYNTNYHYIFIKYFSGCIEKNNNFSDYYDDIDKYCQDSHLIYDYVLRYLLSNKNITCEHPLNIYIHTNMENYLARKDVTSKNILDIKKYLIENSDVASLNDAIKYFFSSDKDVVEQILKNKILPDETTIYNLCSATNINTQFFENCTSILCSNGAPVNQRLKLELLYRNIDVNVINNLGIQMDDEMYYLWWIITRSKGFELTNIKNHKYFKKFTVDKNIISLHVICSQNKTSKNDIVNFIAKNSSQLDNFCLMDLARQNKFYFHNPEIEPFIYTMSKSTSYLGNYTNFKLSGITANFCFSEAKKN